MKPVHSQQPNFDPSAQTASAPLVASRISIVAPGASSTGVATGEFLQQVVRPALA